MRLSDYVASTTCWVKLVSVLRPTPLALKFSATTVSAFAGWYMLIMKSTIRKSYMKTSIVGAVETAVSRPGCQTARRYFGRSICVATPPPPPAHRAPTRHVPLALRNYCLCKCLTLRFLFNLFCCCWTLFEHVFFLYSANVACIIFLILKFTL